MRRLAALLALVIALSLALLAASGGGFAAPERGGDERQGRTAAGVRLVRQPARLREAARVAARGAVGARRFVGRGRGDRGAGGGRGGRTAGVDYSTTNVQEEGVDEPDLVKSNGSTLFVVRSDRLFAVDVRARKPKLAGSLAAAAERELRAAPPRRPAARPLARGRATRSTLESGGSRLDSPSPSRSSLIEVDVSDPGAMRIVRSLALDADYVSARLVGTVARVVTVSGMPQALPFKAPADATPEASAAALARNRAVVRASRIGSWLPRTG